ncbi:hypothetical protein OHA25_50530 [Nonomuraea sp. NBC_00507]|uniref:hypothetical protein n=1 Tax=Nonomuraea sp. NBC_00507 TaxID=2976002 RepID=UPI002E1924FE
MSVPFKKNATTQPQREMRPAAGEPIRPARWLQLTRFGLERHTAAGSLASNKELAKNRQFAFPAAD